MPEKKSIAMIIILTIITCGIYYYVWMYQLSDDVSRFTGITHKSRLPTPCSKNNREKPFFFQIKCRKDTIIHKCQHPVKNLL